MQQLCQYFTWVPKFQINSVDEIGVQLGDSCKIYRTTHSIQIDEQSSAWNFALFLCFFSISLVIHINSHTVYLSERNREHQRKMFTRRREKNMQTFNANRIRTIYEHDIIFSLLNMSLCAAHHMNANCVLCHGFDNQMTSKRMCACMFIFTLLVLVFVQQAYVDGILSSKLN